MQTEQATQDTFSIFLFYTCGFKFVQIFVCNFLYRIIWLYLNICKCSKNKEKKYSENLYFCVPIIKVVISINNELSQELSHPWHASMDGPMLVLLYNVCEDPFVKVL